MRRLFGLVCFFGLTCQSVFAAEQNVKTMRDLCKSSDIEKYALCLGYFSGAGSMLQIIGSSDTEFRKEFGVCGTASPEAMLQAFVNWADAHPEHWHEEYGYVVPLVLSQTWPCK